MDEKLKRRKLDALRRGVHRVAGGEVLAVSTHVIGIGRAGAGVIARMLRDAAPEAPKLHALAIDIGEPDLAELRRLAASIPAARADITIVALDMPQRTALFEALRAYPDYLTLEYPRRHRHAAQPWLPDSIDLPKPGAPVPRALAKAIYGLAYYAGARPLERALRQFAAGVEAATSPPVIAVVFGLSGGTGSGIAVDLARHISTRIFGRRVLVAGIGIAPCAGDVAARDGSHCFPVLNELDCFGDEAKVAGVVAGCGELFRNPFTAGFMVVPQQHVWERLQDLASTQQRVDQEIAGFLTARSGSTLWETLRLLNWVAAPSTQHSAARTPWGARWIHLLGFADTAGPLGIDADLPRRLGLLPGYTPEFIEARAASVADAGEAVARLQIAFTPDVAPQLVAGAPAGSIQFILPCASKTDLALFHDARDAYDRMDLAAKVLDHALLLEQGVLLCETSTRLAGMAGASLGGGDGWIAVPLDALRGADRPPGERRVRDAA